MQSARSIKDHQVAAQFLGLDQRVLADVHRIHVRGGRIHGNVELLGQRVQLVDGRRAVDVRRDQIRLLAVLLAQKQRNFARTRGLTRTLKADHHQLERFGRKVQILLFAAEQLDQLLIDDFAEMLTRLQALEDLVAHGAFLDLVDKPLDHLEVDIGFQQRKAHLAKTFLDVVFIKGLFAAQLRKGGAESFLQALEQLFYLPDLSHYPQMPHAQKSRPARAKRWFVKPD